MAADDKITIHGDQWDRAYVKGQVEWCRTREWHRQPWTPSQNPQHNRRVSPHEHCMICQWVLFDSPNPQESIGYTDGPDWICTECYDRFIAPAQPNV
jgi:hypothetical protein